MLEKRWDSFKMAVDISRTSLLVLIMSVWRFSRGSLGFLESSYIKGIPTADWFWSETQRRLWLSGSRDSARSIIVGWGFRLSPWEMRWFFLRALRFFVHLNASWFHGLHWIDYGLVSFPVIVLVVVMDLRRVFVILVTGCREIRMDLSRGAAFHRLVLHLYICWGET